MTLPITARAAKRFANETPIGRKRRARKMAKELAETHPDAHCELDFKTPLQLLVATILSAQCTDKRVNLVTPKLFKRYRSAAEYAQTSPESAWAIFMTSAPMPVSSLSLS